MSRSKARSDVYKEWQFYQNLQPAGFCAHTRYRIDPLFLPEPPENAVQWKSSIAERAASPGLPAVVLRITLPSGKTTMEVL